MFVAKMSICQIIEIGDGVKKRPFLLFLQEQKLKFSTLVFLLPQINSKDIISFLKVNFSLIYMQAGFARVWFFVAKFRNTGPLRISLYVNAGQIRQKSCSSLARYSIKRLTHYNSMAGGLPLQQQTANSSGSTTAVEGPQLQQPAANRSSRSKQKQQGDPSYRYVLLYILWRGVTKVISNLN